MNDFISRFQDQLSGTLSGFDRLVFLGTLWRNRLSGLKGYLWAHHLGAKDFGEHAEQMSKQVKEAALAPMVAANRPVRYLNSGKDDKQQIALQIAKQDGVTQGPICGLYAVELCSSYAIKRNPETQHPELQIAPRKCVFVYQYWMHPVMRRNRCPRRFHDNLRLVTQIPGGRGALKLSADDAGWDRILGCIGNGGIPMARGDKKGGIWSARQKQPGDLRVL